MTQILRHAGRPDRDDDDDDLLHPAPPFQIFSAEHIVREHNVYLSNRIGPPYEYDQLCQWLRDAGPHDLFRLYINSQGGNLNSGLALIQAMQESQAHVITILNPEAYSMGAMIFLAGDELVAPPNSMLMLHDYSSSAGGKGSEQAGMVLAANGWFSEIMDRICVPFLTKKEIHAILAGQDLWLHGEALEKRMRDLGRARSQANKVAHPRPRRKAAEAAPTPVDLPAQ